MQKNKNREPIDFEKMQAAIDGNADACKYRFRVVDCEDEETEFEETELT